MTSNAQKIDDYLKELPEDRLQPMIDLKDTIQNHLPAGFTEGMLYGMIGFYVDKEQYPAGYHVGKTWSPLPFINIASQKNYIALYHSGIYAIPALQDWFVEEYPKHCNHKLDMGKSCVRFKKVTDIPLELIAQLCEKVTVDRWIAVYEKNLKR
jgi:hypothetical protein